MSSKTWTFKFTTGTDCRADELIFQAIKEHVRGADGFEVEVWDNQIMATYGTQFIWNEEGEKFEKQGTYFHYDAQGNVYECNSEEEFLQRKAAAERIQSQLNSRVINNEYQTLDEAFASLS